MGSHIQMSHGGRVAWLPSMPFWFLAGRDPKE
jgi:hypothetical protein